MVSFYHIEQFNYNYFLQVEGDTLINELPYKYILESYDSSMQIWHKTNKFIREDSQKKVYL
jgi:hypothetical protein